MTAPATAPTSATKTAIITGLDATPPTRGTAGQGAVGRQQKIVGTGSLAINAATSVLTRLIRIPSNCVVQVLRLMLDSAPSTSLTGSVGLWYSDDTRDGTSLINAGNLTAISSAFFLPATDITTFSVPVSTPFAPVDVTFGNKAGAYTDGQYIPSQCLNPIWKAVANSLALQTTPVGAFTSAAIAPQFQTASAGASVYVRSVDPGGYFDICWQETTTGVNTGAINITLFADLVVPG